MGATAQTDIVARLQLRAEQFSSETGQRFAELKSRARSTAQDIRSDFNSAFAGVQQMARDALTLPRTETGSLDLSREIAQLNASAVAADQKSIALREMSIAMSSAEGATEEATQALRLEADAAAVGSLAEEKNAQALRNRAGALEAVQRELSQTTSATRQMTAAEQEALRATNGHRQGVAMMGQQLQDFSVQAISGQNIAVAFSQNIGQAAFALNGMGGAAGRLGAYLSSGWGIAFTIATIVLVPLVSKVLEFNDAAEEAGKKAEDAAKGADAWSEAQAQLAGLIDKTTRALETHNVIVAEAIRLEAIFRKQQGEKEAEDAEKAIRARAGAVYSTPGTGGITYQPGSGGGGGPVMPTNPQFRRVAEDYLAGAYNTKEDPSGVRGARAHLEMIAIGTGGKIDGKSIYEGVQLLLDLGKAREKISAQQGIIDAVDGKGTDERLLPDPRKTRTRRTPDRTGMADSAEEEIARINAEWNEQPRLIDKAFLQTQKLDNLIGQLSDKKPPNWQSLIDQAEATKDVIQRGLITAIGKAFEEPETLAHKGAEALMQIDSIVADLEKRKPLNWEASIAQAREMQGVIRDGMLLPFTEFVRQQRESLIVGEMILAGRDTEAAALQNALRIQEKLGQELSEGQLATLVDIEEQHLRIARAIEDQRRLINIYTGAVGDLQGTFDQFLEDLESRPNKALGSLFSGTLDGFKSLQRNLLSEQLFGGIDRHVEEYIRGVTGKKTPSDIIEEQASLAGVALRDSVTDTASTLDDFVLAVRAATDGIYAAAELPGGSSRAPNRAEQDALASLMSGAANDNGEMYGPIVVVGEKIEENLSRQVEVTDVWNIIAGDLVKNLRQLGIDLPNDFAAALPRALQGASLLSTIGANFGGDGANIGGGIGAILGAFGPQSLLNGLSAAMPIYQLGMAIAQPIGKMLGFDSTNVSIGGLVGGALGKLFGIGPSIKYGSAGLTMNPYGEVIGGSASGRGSAATSGAGTMAGSVADGINAIADQLGAKIMGLPGITVGSWDGKARVALTSTTKALHSNNFGPSVLKDFGQDQQAAIEYAVRYSISHAVVTGISQASQNILKSGQDLEQAINKALLIEAVPKDLKAMLDPAGAAVDQFNMAFQRTVDALKEGGASAEQMAQAQQLYDLQLEQIKNSTVSASQGLKDFLDTLKIGSRSPYSLRDQEAAAMAKLQPFLDKISAGGRVDQDKYTSAANEALDIYRQLYGSGSQFFAFFDMIQSATSKAIMTIDNAVPITPGVPSPFAEATANSAASTAANTSTANDLLDQMSRQLTDLPDRIAAALAARGIDASFMNDNRLFSKVGAN